MSARESAAMAKPRVRRQRRVASSPWAWLPMEWWQSLLLSAVAGYCLHFAFPGFNFWWVAPVSVGAFFVATKVRSARIGFVSGLIFGLAFMLPVISWTNIFVGNLPWVALSLLEAFSFGFAGAAMALVHKAFASPWLRGIVFAALIIGAEYARSYLPFGGFPWARIAFSQADSPLKSLASIGGPPLLGFAVAALGVLLVYVGHGVVRKVHTPGQGHAQWVPRFPVWPVVGAAVLITGSIVLPLPVAPETGGLKVAAIQGSQTMPNSLNEGASPEEVLGNHLRVTNQLIETGYQPDLIIWPESSTDISPERDPNVMSAIQDITKIAGAPILIGTQQLTPDKNRFNLAQMWVPGVGKVGEYAKTRPAPFAEYIPYPGFFRLFSSAVDLVTYQMLPGTKVGAIPVSGAQNPSGKNFNLGIGICFEVAYDDTMRNAVLAGADIVAVPTNNATFGLTDESVQQLAMSQIQAITLGRSVVQASTVGVSGIIAPDGSLLARSGHWVPDALTATVPLRSSQTIATQIGEWSPISLTAIGVLGSLVAALRLNARRKA